MQQKDLQKRLIWAMVILGVVEMILIKSFGNLVLTIFFAAVILIWPFWLDSLTRFKLIPLLDSLNVSNSKYGEDFPFWMRVTIWVFVGIAGSALWTVIVPVIFSLPLWIGRIAVDTIGWHSFRFYGSWQYGWMIAFLMQYLINFIAGWMSNDSDDFSERFDYPEP